MDVSIADEAADLILQLLDELGTAKAVAEEREACAQVVASMEDAYADARLDPALITAAIRGDRTMTEYDHTWAEHRARPITGAKFLLGCSQTVWCCV